MSAGYYFVRCTVLADINGRYYQHQQYPNVHKHMYENYLLARLPDGRWGVGDGAFYIALSGDKADYPMQCKKWSYLVKDYRHPQGVYKTMTMTIQFAPPTTTTPAPTQLANIKTGHSTTSSPPSSTPSLSAGSISTATSPKAALPIPPRKDEKLDTVYVERVGDWERKESGNQITYVNKVTNKSSQYAPAVLCNVGLFGFEERGVQIQFHAPLNLHGDPAREVLKIYHAAVWKHSEKMWNDAVRVLEGELAAAQADAKKVERKTQGLDEELRTHSDTLDRRKAEMALYEEKERFAIERSAAMASRLGKVHVKRDDAAQPCAGFPTGEQIRAEYAALFGDTFEEKAIQARAYIEEVFTVADGLEILVHDVLARLFTATRAYALRVIQGKYKKLADAFGLLPEWGDEQEAEGGSTTRLFFLASQQEPLLRAARSIDEKTVSGIVQKMGQRAERLRVELPAWCERNNWPVSFDLGHMVRTLVWVNTAIELSDPKCYLYPRVGSAHHHIDDKRVYTEVFRPGKKQFGALLAGSEVEVVVPGLYFECPTEVAAPSNSGNSCSSPRSSALVPEVAVPMVAVQVRRLTADMRGIGNAPPASAVKKAEALEAEEQEVRDLGEDMARSQLVA
jgi:hypothetical protein